MLSAETEDLISSQFLWWQNRYVLLPNGSSYSCFIDFKPFIIISVDVRKDCWRRSCGSVVRGIGSARGASAEVCAGGCWVSTESGDEAVAGNPAPGYLTLNSGRGKDWRPGGGVDGMHWEGEGGSISLWGVPVSAPVPPSWILFVTPPKQLRRTLFTLCGSWQIQEYIKIHFDTAVIFCMGPVMVVLFFHAFPFG